MQKTSNQNCDGPAEMTDNTEVSPGRSSYWEGFWRPCGRSPPLPLSIAEHEAFVKARRLSLGLKALQPSDGTSGAPMQPQGSKQTLSGAPCQHRHNNLSRSQAYWALFGGGFQPAGAKALRQKHASGDAQRNSSKLLHSSMAAAATTTTPAAAAAAADYRTTDVPWVVAAPAYQRLSALKGEPLSHLCLSLQKPQSLEGPSLEKEFGAGDALCLRTTQSLEAQKQKLPTAAGQPPAQAPTARAEEEARVR